ncbi:GatB/YqeY domain-containing protein, partial [Pelagibacteraceae bacterium]|nr:GatB/YqeY domain-containing protein [Pelagibacteraceae bacterium]
MSLKKQIDEKLNQALKAKDKSTYPTLRLVLSAIKDAEIAARTKDQKEMSDSDIMAILKKMIKQRNESCEV